MLDFVPNSLSFSDAESEEVSLRVTNTSDSLAGFKFMLTNPKGYAVRPRMGLIKAQETIDVIVTKNKNAAAKDRFRVQSIALEKEASDSEIEALFKDANNKSLIKNHNLALTIGSQPTEESSKQSTNTTSTETTTTTSSSVSGNDSDYGGWGGWFTSKVSSVVNTVQDSANAIGETIQHFVEEEVAETVPQEQTTPSTSTSGGSGEESVFMEVIDTAEKSFSSLVNWGRTFVNETEEIQQLKKAAENITKSTKTSALQLYEQLATNLGIKDRDALASITFEDLFSETGGNQFYEELNSLSLKSQTRLDTILSKLGDKEREEILVILKAIEVLLNSEECYSQTVPETSDIKTTENGKEILTIVDRANTTCQRVIDNFKEVSNDNVAEMAQTALIIIEKLRSELLRTLSLIASKNFEHVAVLSRTVYAAKDLDTLELSESWITKEQLEKDKSLSKSELLAQVIRNYSQFSTAHVVQVGQLYVNTAKAVLSIVDAEIRKITDQNATADLTDIAGTKDKIDRIVEQVSETEVPQYTSKENSVVRESALFFSHILKASVAVTKKNQTAPVTSTPDSATSSPQPPTEQTKEA